jgi:Type I restriction enzyme R protein N terminus (HSDR_N)
MLLSLDYLQFQSALRIKTTLGKQQVYDPVRKKYVALTPEELLRQLTLQYLLQYKEYPINRIRSEIGIQINGMPRRCDIVVFDQAIKPWLLVECKSPKVILNQSVMEQAARYNLSLSVPYMAITNGLHTYSCALDYTANSFLFLEDFPDKEMVI